MHCSPRFKALVYATRDAKHGDVGLLDDPLEYMDNLSTSIECSIHKTLSDICHHKGENLGHSLLQKYSSIVECFPTFQRCLYEGFIVYEVYIKSLTQ